MAKQLAVGDKAPAFALKDQDGKTVRLSSFKGKPVVVYFYPKADTPGCTQQSCNVRDAFPQLKKLKAVALGISPDPVAKQKKFDDKYELGFPLLSDAKLEVIRRYDLLHAGAGPNHADISRPAEFLVDGSGVVRWRNLTENIAVRLRPEQVLTASDKLGETAHE